MDPGQADSGPQGLVQGRRVRGGGGRLRLRGPGAEEGPEGEAHGSGRGALGEEAPGRQDPFLGLRRRPAGQPGVPVLLGVGGVQGPAVPVLRRRGRLQRLRGLRPPQGARQEEVEEEDHRGVHGPPVGGHQRERTAAGLQRGREDYTAQVRPDLLLGARGLQPVPGLLRTHTSP